jgi:hypothetical protein
MTDPKPLFDDEKTFVGPLQLSDDLIEVKPLALPDDSITVKPVEISKFEPPAISVGPLSLPNIPENKSVPAVTEIFAIDEHPAVSQAYKRGIELYPDIMKELGHSVRNHLNKVMPISFEKISEFGSDVLTHSAKLVSEMVESTENIHEVHAEERIKRILHDADPVNHTYGFKAILSGGHKFNLGAAQEQLFKIGHSLQTKLSAINSKIEELKSVQNSLKVYVTVFSILQNMADHTNDGPLIARKGNLFNTSLQEVNIAVQQAVALQQITQETIMRCEEVRVNVLPSYGIR